MIPKEFKYNANANYQHSSTFKVKTIDIIDQNIVVTSDNDSFHVSFPNLFEKYTLPYVETDALVQRWRSNWMLFWQNQLNFALWCSTTGSGVDFNNHLKDKGMIGSLFRFHIYYQTRRILFEMSAAMPQDPSWNAFDNNFDQKAYERICKEFNVDINTDWRQKQSDNQGLGGIYNYWTNDGYHPFDVGTEYDKTKFSFTDYNSSTKLHIDYIAQGPEAKTAWSTFILDESNGFTKAGVERINDSIRTYCWAILGSQSQTRTEILGTGTAFDAQKQFLANVEDAIHSPVDLPSQIARYQNTLKYARSKVDFVFGIGLYMSPSNMALRIGTIQDYNNEIVIATASQSLGLNNDVNVKPVLPSQPQTIKGTKTKQSHPESSYHKEAEAYAKSHGLSQKWVDEAGDISEKIVEQIAQKYSLGKYHHPDVKQDLKQNSKQDPNQNHEDKKTALIVGSIAVGITVMILYKV